MPTIRRRPSPPTYYDATVAAKVFRDAQHQLRGLVVAYCYDRCESPTPEDLRWTDEVSAEMARVSRAVDTMIDSLLGRTPGP